MSADWKVAPKDATHYFDGDRLYAAHWLKNGFYCVTGFENDVWRADHQPLPLSRCEERPKQPQAWSGDGLPPVGAVCEFYECGEWREVQVMYLSQHTILLKFKIDEHDDPEGAYSPEDLKFRAILTPAQIRESAIRDIMDIAQVDCRVTAARLVDAGFKREGV